MRRDRLWAYRAVRALVLAAPLAAVVGGPAAADPDDWRRGPAFRAHEWREHEWREHEWRARERREHLPLQTYVYPFGFVTPVQTPPPVLVNPVPVILPPPLR